MLNDSKSLFPNLDALSAFWADRYDFIKLLQHSHHSEAYLGRYKASNIPVLIEIYNDQKAFDGLDLWDKCNKKVSTLETLIEYGIFTENLFYTISNFPFSDVFMSLSQVGSLRLQHVVHLGIQLCEVLHVLHDNKLYYLELDPARILVKPYKDGIDLISLRKTSLRNQLGWEITKFSESNAENMSQDDRMLENLYMNSEIPHLLAGTDKLLPRLSRLTGWQYSTLNPFIAPEVCLGEKGEFADIYSVIMILQWLITRKDKRIIEDVMDEVSPKLNVPKELKETIKFNKLLEIIFKDKFSGDLIETPPELNGILKFDNISRTRTYKSIDSLRNALSMIVWKSLQIVVKNVKGRPIKNVWVRIQNITYPTLDEDYSTITNSDGQATFNNLCSGSYSINVKHQNYYPETARVTIAFDKGERKIREVVLTQLSLTDWLKKKYAQISERREE